MDFNFLWRTSRDVEDNFTARLYADNQTRADRIAQTRGALDVHRSMVIAHSDFSLDIVFH